MTLRFSLPLVLVALEVGAPTTTRAGCCDVRKVDDDVLAISLRVCEPAGAHACGAMLFEGPLSFGQSQHVCTTGETILYQEDTGGGLGPPVEAVCSGDDVEI